MKILRLLAWRLGFFLIRWAGKNGFRFKESAEKFEYRVIGPGCEPWLGAELMKLDDNPR